MRIFRKLEEIPEIENAVVTIGSFDGVHRGHQKIIARINQLATEINGKSVIVTFDPHPRSVIYPKDQSLSLLTSLEEKIELLEKFGVDILVIVPFTVEFSQMHPRDYVENFLERYFKPSFIVIGYDHRFGLNREGNIDLLKAYQEKFQFKVVQIEAQEIEEITISSTKIRKAILNAEMSAAHKFLNYHYVITGKVISGEQIGKELGFPTANIQISEKHKLIPPDGIYAVFVKIGAERYQGMLYIGKRPTLKGKEERRIEVNIFEFDHDIYGETLTLELVMFIRDDMTFDNLQKLKVQLHEDEQHAKLVLHQYLVRQMEQSAKCTIAIINYNGLDYLESYLPSVLYSSKDDVDILVIDNASTDESVAYLEEWHPEVNVLAYSKNYGFAEGYNRSMKDVDTEFTVLLNNDVLVTENWLDPILKLMSNDKTIGACQPKIRSLSEPTKFEHAGAAGGYLDALSYAFCKGRIFDEVELDEGQFDHTLEVFWASGAAMVVRTELFNNLGGFDETYFAHYEEIDLCWRMKRAGYKVMSVNESVVYHLGGGTLPYQSSKKIYLNFRNSLKTFLKNETGLMKYPKFILRLVLDGGAALLLFMKGQWDAIPTVVKAHLSVYGNFRKIMKSKRNFNRLIEENAIGPENHTGKYNKVIPISFYLLGKRKFEEL
ncbi:bifunctional riboflavin kinase/FAD synthetase [Portibacter marinus]|uniref:bifunctional riboflavin kinase/FAD synthetase n=1 Tax=Portibacter marinus TaxID=2898660 RepID=UPI001F0017E6|nr:bifunctional riboflavin kinase/FAD synthetase [Portibacter marinus]